jgi:hypothetical protein
VLQNETSIANNRPFPSALLSSRISANRKLEHAVWRVLDAENYPKPHWGVNLAGLSAHSCVS